MRNSLRFLFVAALVFFVSSAQADEKSKSIRALLVTGGCCHNYKYQSKALIAGVAKEAKVDWKVVNEGGSGTRAQIALYDNPSWAKGYDVVVHNECFANTADEAYIRKITKVHKAGVPAVVIHCAMHTYRAAKIDEWRKFLGVTSRRHDHQSRYPVKKVAPKHPILKGMPDNWVTPKDELYIVDKVWPTAKPLATSKASAMARITPWLGRISTARPRCSARPTGIRTPHSTIRFSRRWSPVACSGSPAG